MPSENYETLLAKYNRLISRFRDLEAQMDEKEKNWAKIQKQMNVHEQLARELCETILAKEIKSAEFFGKEYSWGKVPLDDLLRDSKAAYSRQNASRTELLKGMQTKVATLEQNYQNLLLQYEHLSQTRTTQPTYIQQPDPNTGEIADEPVQPTQPVQPAQPAQPPVEKMQQEAPTTPIIATTPAQTSTPVIPEGASYDVQKAAKNGAIQVEILEDDADVSDVDLRLQGEAVEAGVRIEVGKKSPKIHPSTKTKKQMEHVKESTKTQMGTYIVNEEEVLKTMTDRKWYVLQAIGETGEYDFEKIAAKATELNPDKKKPSGTMIRNDLFQLITNGIIEKEPAPLPFASTYAVYNISSIGSALYTKKYGKAPAESKIVQIIKDHDNLEHGLGIIGLAEILRKSNQFSKVTTERKELTFKLSSGDTYIPDVMAVAQKYTAYFEYELGNHTPSHFRIKLNKMAIKTKFLNIICNSQSSCETINKLVLDWIESRGGPGFLPRGVVRVTTITKLKNAENGYANPDIWTYSYNLGESKK